MGGPFLGLLFWTARIGPSGLLWFEGKGGETIQTPLGRTVVAVLFAAGAVVGALLGWAFDAILIRNDRETGRGRDAP